MRINNVGYNHSHDSDFYVDRPEGSGDYLLLLLKTPCVIETNGREHVIPENTVYIFRKGRPQRYRSVSGSMFSNDWIHFDFENDEERRFLELGLEYGKPYSLDSINFFSFCIKEIASEYCSSCRNREDTMEHFMFLVLNKVSDLLEGGALRKNESYYEVLMTIRSKVYSRPYETRTVEETAHEVRMSPSNFQHLYKKYFGVSFIQDVIKSRIEYSCMLLTDTNLSSEEVAHQSGYNHYAHFVRQFKGITGVNPSEYRKRK